MGNRSIAKWNLFQQKVSIDAFTTGPFFKSESNWNHLCKLIFGQMFSTLFCTHKRIFGQVLTTFMVKDSFCDALKACPKITKKFLFDIKSTQGKNYGSIMKINKQAFKQLMILVAHFHQAREICMHLQQGIEQADWSDPYVTECFECIKEHLKEHLDEIMQPITPPFSS